MYYDLLTRIKNAEKVSKDRLKVPFSKFDFAVAEILKQYGFIKDFEKKGKSLKKFIDLKLPRTNKSIIAGVKIISRPSKRIYRGFKELKPVRNGFGLGVISTPQGVMSVTKAKKLKLGGEYLFEIW